MNFKLGISDDITRGCQDVKQVLEAVRAHYMAEQAEKAGKQSMAAEKTQKASSLTAFEIKELTQRMGGQSQAVVNNPSDVVLEEEVDPE